MKEQQFPTQAEFKREIEQWLIEFVEKPSPALQGWAPCPYARKARVQSRIKYVFVRPEAFETEVEIQIQAFSDSEEVVVIGTVPSKHSVDDISKISKRLRDRYWSQDFWVLFDHPEDLEEIRGVKMNQGQYLLAMVQRLSKLSKASEHLEKEGYYRAWSEDDKRMMLEERKEKARQLTPTKESVPV